MLRFSTDPFYLYPIKEDMIDRLFVDREDEIKIAKSLLSMRFEDAIEICVVAGGIGIGKSSFLHYVSKLAEEMAKNVEFFNNPNEFYSGIERIKGDNCVGIVDDVGKVSDQDAWKFYNFLEMELRARGGTLFFSDTYNRRMDTLRLRSFIVSQSVSLPRGLSKEKLTYFLNERMKNCLAPDDIFESPFENEVVEMAATRSSGNLRNFLNYMKNAWTVGLGGGKDIVNSEDMKNGIIITDRSLLGNCDLIDFKILWYSTIGTFNKSYIAHQCNIDSKTLESRLNSTLIDISSQHRSGKDVIVTSVYRHLKDGEEILEKIIEGLGLHLADITDGKE